MDLPQEYRGQLEEICDLYNKAEVDLKNVGRVMDTLISTWLGLATAVVVAALSTLRMFID